MAEEYTYQYFHDTYIRKTANYALKDGGLPEHQVIAYCFRIRHHLPDPWETGYQEKLEEALMLYPEKDREKLLSAINRTNLDSINGDMQRLADRHERVARHKGRIKEK